MAVTDPIFDELEDVLAHLNIVFAERDCFRELAYYALSYYDQPLILERKRREYDLALKASKAYHRKYRKDNGGHGRD